MNIYSYLINLSNLMLKSNPHKASLIRKLADYEKDHKARIHEQTKDRHMPFEDLFKGRDRIYEDFQFTSNGDVDLDVKKVLNNYGYYIVDYIAGLASKHPDHSSPTIKIAKILKKIEKTIGLQIVNLKSVKARYKDLINASYKWNELKFSIKQFNNSSLRAQKSANNYDLQIVYTRQTDDTAKMSTDRDWSSCFSLDTGGRKHCVIEEIMAGGIVAYLIKKEDQNIEKPLSRVLIKRFESKSNGEIKMAPEGMVYGLRSLDFLRTVSEFCNRYNKHLDDSYNLLGSKEWSDSFDTKNDINLNHYMNEYNTLIESKIKDNSKKDSFIKSMISLYHSFESLSIDQLLEIFENRSTKEVIPNIEIPESFGEDKENPIDTLFADTLFQKLNNEVAAKKYKNEIINIINDDTINSDEDKYVKYSMRAVYFNYLTSNQDDINDFLHLSSDDIKYLLPKIDPKNIFIDHDLIQLNDKEDFKNIDDVSSIVILNSITLSEARTFDILAGSRSTDQENYMLNQMTGTSNAFDRILKSIAKNTLVQNLSFNLVLKAFSKNKDRRFINTVMNNCISDLRIEEEEFVQRIINTNLDIIKQLRNDDNNKTRRLARTLYKEFRRFHVN